VAGWDGAWGSASVARAGSLGNGIGAASGWERREEEVRGMDETGGYDGALG